MATRRFIHSCGKIVFVDSTGILYDDPHFIVRHFCHLNHHIDNHPIRDWHPGIGTEVFSRVTEVEEKLKKKMNI